MPAGRPTDYSAELADAICLRLIDGESLRGICGDETMPVKTTVLRWLIKYEEFRAQYTQARELQAESDLDEIVEIADDSVTDWAPKIDKRTGETDLVISHDHVQRAKLRIETRLKRAEKMHPRKYSPRLNQDIVVTDSIAAKLQEARDRAKQG